jgi:ADP-ribose pyrophosphatase YjhB (NUDIX family)
VWAIKVLLCRRAIEPRQGYWTIPAGYLEQEETAEAGAMREVKEEAGADVALSGLLGVYSIPRISQVQLIYRARLLSPDIAPGQESLAVGLYDWTDIPWPDLAFPTVRWALEHHQEIGTASSFAPRTNPSGRHGTSL